MQVVAEKIGVTRNFLKLHRLGFDAVVTRSVTEENTNVLHSKASIYPKEVRVRTGNSSTWFMFHETRVKYCYGNSAKTVCGRLLSQAHYISQIIF